MRFMKNMKAKSKLFKMDYITKMHGEKNLLYKKMVSLHSISFSLAFSSTLL